MCLRVFLCVENKIRLSRYSMAIKVVNIKEVERNDAKNREEADVVGELRGGENARAPTKSISMVPNYDLRRIRR